MQNPPLAEQQRPENKPRNTDSFCLTTCLAKRLMARSTVACIFISSHLHARAHAQLKIEVSRGPLPRCSPSGCTRIHWSLLIAAAFGHFRSGCVTNSGSHRGLIRAARLDTSQRKTAKGIISVRLLVRRHCSLFRFQTKHSVRYRRQRRHSADRRCAVTRLRHDTTQRLSVMAEPDSPCNPIKAFWGITESDSEAQQPATIKGYYTHSSVAPEKKNLSGYQCSPRPSSWARLSPLLFYHSAIPPFCGCKLL